MKVNCTAIYKLYYCFILCLPLLSSCAEDKNGDRLIFSIEDDKNLGLQVASEVDSTYQAQGKLIERNDPRYSEAYQHLNRVVDTILNSGQVAYRSEFDWEVTLIKDDSVLNAFATPAGHIYVFTGLIKYLDNEDQFAGVLGHEIAHADKRHTTKQLQTQYGITLLLSVALGNNPGTLAQIATGLAGLKFSRDAEAEADNFSVVYLSGTNKYACNGAADFFVKMQNENQGSGNPEFLSTHPDPGNRVAAINAKAQEIGCSTGTTNNQQYEQFKASLNR